MPAKRERPDLRLLVHTKDENSYGMGQYYFKATVNLVLWTPEGLRNPQFGAYSGDPGGEFADFRISGQLSSYDGKVDAKDFYGHEPTFADMYSVNETRAMSMAKTLKRVNAGLDKLTAKYGTATDFSAYIGRIADVIGCTVTKPIGYLLKEVTYQNSWDDGEYRWTDVDGLRYHLAKKTDEWLTAHSLIR